MAEAGTTIENLTASTSETSNYVIDDRSGFRILPSRARKEDWSGYVVDKDRMEAQNPQDRIRVRASDRFPGSKSPEPTDSFVAAYPNGVSASDL
jgi:hypothetical protein